MITEKYAVDYNLMTPKKRNKKLREMLSKDKVIVFPEKQFVDGLPELKIMNPNLKLLTDNGPSQKEKDKVPKTAKAKTDTGLPP